MTYTPDKPKLTESSDELRARIPGWGTDLDRANRPSFPRERFDPDLNGARWELPEQQPEKWPRERSIEHQRLTPVFGTSTPPKGLSGVIRKHAYRRYSEARAAHWLLLIAADRVDALESTVRSFGTLHPDNPVTETGVLSELSHHPIGSRFGQGRADVKHLWLDPVIVSAPWVAAGALALRAGRALGRAQRRAQQRAQR
jgi:hypothetical protein